MILGTVGQAFAVTSAPYLIPVFLYMQLFGLAGSSSLLHESWHRRSHPNRWMDRQLIKWFVAPIFLTPNIPAFVDDHWYHHKMPGEEGDPNRLVWVQTEKELRLSLIKRILVIPVAFGIIRGLLTGKRAMLDWDPETHKSPPHLLVRAFVFHAVWATSMLLISIPTLLVGWLLPLALGSAAVHLREYCEHAKLPDSRTAAYDTICSTFERHLIPGGFFNYHALHHAFPEIPQRNLPKLYRVIEGAIDMKKDYHGTSSQIGLKKTYLRPRAVIA